MLRTLACENLQLYALLAACYGAESLFFHLEVCGMTCRVDESQLTGEAEDVVKDANSEPLLLSGSKVLEGNGRALVIAVGPNSQSGIIAGLAQGPSQDSGGLRSASLLLLLTVSLGPYVRHWYCC